MDPHQLELFNQIIADFSADEISRPVTAYKSPEEVHQQIDLSIPEKAKPVDTIFQQLSEIVLMTPKTATHGFFNQLFGGRNDVATFADMLSSLLNSSMYTYKVSGIHTLIEQEVVKTMCGYAGFTEGEGIFCPGGSISNMNAMIMARNNYDSKIRDKGLPGGNHILYASELAHYSINKNAGLIGIGRDNVRAIKADPLGKMCPEALKEAIEEDLQKGNKPFMVIATVGTTVLGSFDPLREIAGIAKKYNLWVHADGAWGGSLLLSETTAHKLDGIELADSFTWDAHKMMGVPLIASVLLVKKPGLLREHFNEAADYLFQVDSDELNLGTQSIQCARRNDALKVWAAMQHYGKEGYAKRIEKMRDLTLYVTEKVKVHPQLELCMEPEALNICFSVKGKCSETICEQLMIKGLAKVGYGDFEGQRYIRMICVNPELTYEDIDRFLDSVLQVAAEV